jgi:ElaB/YqjD/DUF883 family membrane-anchored ribosome-binding protein
MSDTGSETAGVQGAVADVNEMVSEQATKVKDVGRRELRDQLNDRTAQVGGQARSLAEALRRSGTEVRQGPEGAAVAAQITSGVADRLERAGDYLERANGDEMLRDAERFIRSRPWLLAGAAAAAGLAASRIVKASSERRYKTSSPTPLSVGRGQDRGSWSDGVRVSGTEPAPASVSVA